MTNLKRCIRLCSSKGEKVLTKIENGPLVLKDGRIMIFHESGCLKEGKYVLSGADGEDYIIFPENHVWEIEHGINKLISDGRFEDIHSIFLYPRKAVLLFLERVITEKNFESAQVIDGKIIIPNVSLATRRMGKQNFKLVVEEGSDCLIKNAKGEILLKII